jgi:hypothetical protein
VAARSSASAASPAGDRILVVCHHDARARDATLGFVTQLGLQASALAAPPDPTDRAFFDRLERLDDLKFAVIHPATSVSPALSSALMLELGFLIRALGRDRICFLVAGNSATAPAWEGVGRIPLDEAGTWHLLLARAVKQAGLNVDMNRAL